MAWWKFGIELFAFGFDARDAVPFEHVEHLPLGHLHAFNQVLDRLVRNLACVFAEALNGTAHIVPDRQHIAREHRHGVFPGVFFFTIRPAAQVLHFRHQAQYPVAQFIVLRLQGGGFRLRTLFPTGFFRGTVVLRFIRRGAAGGALLFCLSTCLRFGGVLGVVFAQGISNSAVNGFVDGSDISLRR